MGWGGHSSSGHQKHLGVSIGSLLLSKGRDNIDKAPVVLDATLRTASLLFLLLLLVNLDSDRGDQLWVLLKTVSNSLTQSTCPLKKV